MEDGKKIIIEKYNNDKKSYINIENKKNTSIN
jgi:hypothetical protein